MTADGMINTPDMTEMALRTDTPDGTDLESWHNLRQAASMTRLLSLDINDKPNEAQASLSHKYFQPRSGVMLIVFWQLGPASRYITIPSAQSTTERVTYVDFYEQPTTPVISANLPQQSRLISQTYARQLALQTLSDTERRLQAERSAEARFMWSLWADEDSNS